MNNSKLKLLELFGGIGACTAALKRLGIDFEVVDYVEIDKYAVASYNAINNTVFEPQDITKWDKDIEVDLIMSGSPCQDFSLAGHGKGGDKGSGTRSSLMYETIRIVEKLKAKYVIWENVKNLLSKKHKHNFDDYLEALDELGYNNYYQVLNAKDYGIPQNRERVFTISIRKDINNLFTFPQKQNLKLCVKDLLEKNVDDCFYKVCSSMVKEFEKPKGKVKEVTNKKYCNTITTKQIRWNNAGMIVDFKGLRYLTPKECFKFMGFTDEDFEKAAKVNSKTQLYKQAGNSIVVNVLECIFKNLF